MRPKPAHLGPAYGRQFADTAVATAYDRCPPYPAELLAILTGLLPDAPRTVLDAGCGSGDLARPLAALADRIVTRDHSGCRAPPPRTVLCRPRVRRTTRQHPFRMIRRCACVPRRRPDMQGRETPKQASISAAGKISGPLASVGLATTLAFIGTLLAIVVAQSVSDAVPSGSRYRGNGALVLLVIGALAALTAAWALLALRFGSARHPALGSLAAGVAALLLAFPSDVLPAWGLPESTLFVLAVLSTLAGVGLANRFMPPVSPVLLAGLATLLLQWTLLIVGDTGPQTVLPLALPPTLIAPLVTALLVRSAARWRLAGWLAAGGFVAVPCGLIGGYAAGILLLAAGK